MDIRRCAPLLSSADSARFCYLRLRALEQALAEPRILDGLVNQLEVPGKAGVLKAMTDPEKLVAIEHQIMTYRKARTSVWREVNPAVLAVV